MKNHRIQRSLSERVALEAIARDASFVGRVMGFSQNISGPNSSLLGLGLISYYGLIVSEGSRVHEKLGFPRSRLMSDPAGRLALVARNSMKRFDDTRRDLDELVEHYNSHVMGVYERVFGTETAPAPGATGNLGVWTSEGDVVLTTHEVARTMGIDDDSAQWGSEWRDLTTEFGEFFGENGATISAGSCVRSTADGPTEMRDVFAEEYYERIFNGPSTPVLNAMLLGFLANLNFAAAFVRASDPRHPDFYSALKIRYLTLYHVLQSLVILNASHSHLLSTVSQEILAGLVKQTGVDTMLGASSRPFRNTLAHYIPDTRLDFARLELDDPLFGLLQSDGLGDLPAEFERQTAVLLDAVRAQLRSWYGDVSLSGYYLAGEFD